MNETNNKIKEELGITPESEIELAFLIVFP